MPDLAEQNQNQRILLATSTYFPTVGGQELVVERLIDNFVSQGQFVVLMVPFRSWLYMLTRESRQYRVVPTLPMQALFLRSGTRIFNAVWCLYLRLIISFFRINLISSHGFFPTGILVAQVAQRIGCRHVACCHGADIQVDEKSSYGMRLDPRVDELVRRTVGKVDHFIAISNSVKQEYAALGIEEERITSIPNGFGDERFVEAVSSDVRLNLRARFKLNASDFVVLTVGRNHPKKNFKGVVKIAERLSPTRPEIKFVICGSDVTRLGKVPGNVILLDPTVEQWSRNRIPDDNIVALYQCSDVFLFPSFIETFGIVLVEAMSFGLPVVCSSASGCADVTGYGAFGINCDPNDTEAFARNIERLYSSESHRKSLATKSRQRSVEFRWSTVVGNYLELFRRLV